MEEQIQYVHGAVTPSPAIVLDSGPGWRLLLKNWGRSDFFVEVEQPDGSLVWYTVETLVTKSTLWDAVEAF